MSLQFNPNKKPEQRLWATYIPNRKPKFKTYTQKNYARNAFYVSSVGILYEYIDEEWVERYNSDGSNRSRTCENCGKNLYETSTYMRGKRRWKPGKDVYEMWNLCDECDRKDLHV